MPSSQVGAGHGPAFLEWLTPDMMDRIEVIKGPISALYGDQYRAGAANISTVTGAAPSSVGFTFERYGGRRASLVASQAVNAVQSVLVADLYRADSHRKGASVDRDSLSGNCRQRMQAGATVGSHPFPSGFTAAGYLRYESLASGAVDRSAAKENALLAFGSGKRAALVFNRAPAAGEEGFYATAYPENFDRVRGASAVTSRITSDRTTDRSPAPG